MSEITRLYCTHCTFGTSALETASADNAAKVLGYSVRASSLPDADRGRLRQVFRSIERLLSYDLPRDASAADKEKLDAAAAPRRLIFLPTLGDSQVVGQVCYRTHDTAGRPGSYFADMLVSRLDPRQPEQSWSPVECLELWAADYDGSDRGGWWCDSENSLAGREKDGAAIPFAPVSAVHEIRELAETSRPPLVSVEVLRAFLFETGDRIETLDVGRVIPPRWREMPADTRRALFAGLLQGAIDILQQPRDTLVLAVEPSLAALLFYGVCRLLPPKLTISSKNSSGISFSTYEPFPERPMTRLVATTFLHGDASADLPADVYQRGFACNTFRDDCNTWQSTTGRGRIPQPGAFVNKIVDRLGVSGATGAEAAQEVNGLLQAINSLEKISARSLDGLICIDDFVTEYATGSRPLADLEDGPRIQPKTDEEVFRRQRFRRLIEQGELESRTKWPSDLLTAAIDWLGDSLSGLWRENGDVVRLLRRWLPTSPEGLKRLASSKPPEEVIRDAVISVTRAQRRLPDCLPEILDAFSRPSRGNKSAAMLEEILSGLEDPQNILLASNPTLLGDTILAALQAIITSGNPPPPDFVESLLARILDDEKRSQDDKWSVLRKSATLADSVPHPVRKLGRTLNELFDHLVISPPSALAGRERGATVEALERWASLTDKWQRNHALLLNWKALFDSLASLTDEANKRTGNKLWSGGTTGPKEVLKKVFQTIDKLNAEPSQEWSPQRDRHRRDRLKQALQLARPADDVRQRVEEWIKEELRKEQKLATVGASRSFKREMILGGVIAALVIAIVAVGVVAFYREAARDWFSFPRRTAAGKQGGPESTGHTPDVEKNSAAPEESQKKAGRSQPTGANALADQTNPPGGQPPQAKPLTPDDLGLKAAFEAGALVISWQRDLGAATTFLTLERRDEHLDNFETKYEFRTIISDATVSRKSEFRYPSQSPGKDSVEYDKEYRVTLTAKRGSEPKVKAEASAAIPTPPAPAVESIDLDLGSPDKPVIKVSLNKPADLQKYGEVEYCLKCEDKTVGQAALPKGETDVRIPIEKEKWKPEDLRGKQCTLSVVAKSIRDQQGKPSTPVIVKADIGGFMNRQLERRTVLGVPNVWPLVDGNGNLSDAPFLLHPFVAEGTIDLALLSPQYYKTPYSLVLNKTHEDKDAWKISLQPSIKDISALPIAHGEFQVDRSHPWAPHLRYVPAENNDDILSLRVAAAKLFVDLSSVNAGSHEIQLIEPLMGKALTFDKNEFETVYDGRNVVAEKSLVFQCSTLELAGDSPLRVEVKRKPNEDLQFDWRYDRELFAYQKVWLSCPDPRGIRLKRDPLKWAEGCSVVGGRFEKYNPVKDSPFGAHPLLPDRTMLAYKVTRKQEVDGLERVISTIPNKSSKPTGLEKKLGEWKAKGMHPDAISVIDDCLARLQPLVEREKQIDALCNAIQGAKFAVTKWKIMGRVADGSRVSDVIYMVCDPTAATK